MSTSTPSQVRFVLESAEKPMRASEIYEYCPDAPTIQTVHAALSYMVKKNAVLKHKPDGSPATFELNRGKRNQPKLWPVKAPAAKPNKTTTAKPKKAMKPKRKNPKPQAPVPEKEIAVGATPKLRMDFLERSLERAQLTLDEYLAEVADPLILEPLIEIRDLAIKRLNQVSG